MNKIEKRMASFKVPYSNEWQLFGTLAYIQCNEVYFLQFIKCLISGISLNNFWRIGLKSIVDDELRSFKNKIAVLMERQLVKSRTKLIK